jgi:hypothetical protein
VDYSSLSDFLLATAHAPFAIALGILGGLLLVELVTLLIGMPLSAKLDALLHLDLHAPDLHAPDLHGPHGGLDITHEAGIFGTALDWLNAGRIPLLVLLMTMLAAFGSLGYLIKGVSHSTIGRVPTALAAILALLATIPITRQVSLLVAKVVPRDETYVVDAASLVGCTGVIVTGPLAIDTIARVKVKDAHGNLHFPWVRTTDPALRLEDGGHVLLVEQRGGEYLVVAADPSLIA